MKKFALSFVFFSFMIFGINLLFPVQLKACSAFSFSLNNDFIAAKGYDWNVGTAVILSNLRGERVSIPTGSEAPLTWNARFGSITFNQYGQFQPNGGINEAGLVIEVLWLDETYYPVDNDKIPLNELQWVQYHLDVCQSVDEVVESMKNFVIVPVFGKLHYFLADKTGNTAVVEFMNGEMNVTYGDNHSCKAITNDSYARSINYLKAGSNIGGYNASLNRFVRLAEALENADKQKKKKSVGQAADVGFEILEKVWIKEWTKWNIVYNISKQEIYYKTDISQSIKKIDISDFNFAENAVPLYLNINNFYSGYIFEQFVPFTLDVNRELIVNSIKLTGVPLKESDIELIAFYPETMDEVQKFMSNRSVNTGTLVVKIDKLKSNDGIVNIGLFDSAESFDKTSPFNGGRVGVTNNVVTYVFYNIPLNKYYALGFYHDENYNGRMDRNFFGLPSESYGFSGKGRKFDTAKFLFSKENAMVMIKAK